MDINNQYLYPVFALVFLKFFTLFVMGFRRFKAIKGNKIDVRYFKTYKETFEIPDELQTSARHYINLFELPVLFYALIPLLILFQKFDSLNLFLCWIFVVARYLHAFIHMFGNKLIWRMRAFAVGSVTLIILWVRFFIQII